MQADKPYGWITYTIEPGVWETPKKGEPARKCVVVGNSGTVSNVDLSGNYSNSKLLADALRAYAELLDPKPEGLPIA